MKIKKGTILTAIICIAALDAIALLKGIDGTYFSLALAAIAGLAGWTIPAPKIK